jgi:hypothetical protein
MKILLVLILSWIVSGCVFAAEDVTAKIALTVKNLGPSTKPEDLAPLRANPLKATELLIQQIALVCETKILAENQKSHPAEMRVIWSIRALRYLSGLNFAARTKHRFHDKKADRAQFLGLTAENEVVFFGTWMSRDSIYLAPRDAQLEIIEKWKKWATSEAKNHKFVTPKDITEWYP